MATVYSLIAWGGRTGKAVSLDASSDVVTLTNHGLRNGTKLWPSGTLPAELNTSTPVYARSTGDNTFTLHTSSAGAIANTGQITFAGSSTYAAVVLKSDLVSDPANALAPYGLSDLSRWGSSGSERIYDSLSNFVSARTSAPALEFDTEVCEIGEAWNDKTTEIGCSIPCASTIIETKINGVRTPAFHAGVYLAGYILERTTTQNSWTLSLNNQRSTADGFTIQITGAGYAPNGLNLNNSFCNAKNMFLVGRGDGTGSAIGNYSIAQKIQNNVSIGWEGGLYVAQYQGSNTIANNIFAKNTTGILTQNTNASGDYYNNISIGNTTNYGYLPSAGATFSNNAGLSGEAWGASTRVTIATTDFLDYTNNDFRPASISSPQVDSGVLYYDAYAQDVAGNERPNYNNGGLEAYDIGAYEFDHGYGNHPASHVLTLDNVVVGSRVFIRDQADTTTHHNDIAASSTVVITITVYGDSRDNWRIRIRRASEAPKYLPYETLMTAAPGSSSIYVSQLPDPIAS